MLDYDRESEDKILRETVRAFPMEWFRQNEWQMCLQGVMDLVVLALGVCLTLQFRTPWVCIPVWIIMAGRLHGLGVLMHDLTHVRHLESQFYKRVLIDAIVCYPMMMNMDYYGYAHALHHQWSNIPKKDPYFLPLNRMSTPRYLLFVLGSTLFLPMWLALRILTFPLALVLPPLRRFHARNFTQFGAAADRESERRFQEGEKLWIWGLGPCLAWWGLGFLLTRTGQWANFGWSYGIPMVLSVLVGQVRLACDHVYEEARDNSIPEQLVGSTNIDAPAWQRIIVAPHSAGFHGMHHVAPNIPNWYWKSAHDRFVASGSKVYAHTVYPGYGSILAKLLRDQAAWARSQRAKAQVDDKAAAASAGTTAPAGGFTVYAADAPEPGFRELPTIALKDGIARSDEPELMKIPSIDQINASSKSNAFRLEDLAWRAADKNKFFAPEAMSHLYFTDLYRTLTPEERLSYNQTFAEGVSEQFVFLEQVLLVRGLKSFLHKSKGRVTGPLAEACEFFINEEDKHSAMFRRLLVEANPAIYEKEQFHVYKLSEAEQRFMTKSMEDPEFYLWWIWTATLFEERTIDFHRKYQAQRDEVDGMYADVHHHHCKDELRHLQMDHHFIDALWAKAPAWKKEINLRFFEKILWAYAHPRRTVIASIQELVKRHPRLKPMEDALIEAGLGVASSRAWHEATYSRKILPNTFAQFDRFPEMHGLGKVLPLYQPRPSVQPDAARVN